MSPASGRRRAPLVRALPALAVGALCAMAAEQLSAAAPLPSPLARDEEFVVRFSGAAPLARVVGGAITVATPPVSPTPEPRGRFVAGRTFIDPAKGRAVVVRPEALREYFVLGQGMTRADADVQTARVLTRVERTGDLKPLDKIDESLRVLFGPLAGTRLDDPQVFAWYPSQLQVGSPLTGLRQLVAGDDALWSAYMLIPDVSAFSQLQLDERFERFFHPIDPATGSPSESSVLRQREHRRVLMRRTHNLLTYLPEIPTRADLADAGFAPGATYDLTVAPGLRGVTKNLLPDSGGVLKFVHGLAAIRTADDTGDGGVFRGGLASGGSALLDPPRVVNMTPPDGESMIDLTTDWEDPDNQFTVPIPDRRPFVVRLRFSRPLDPRTVDAAHFTLVKTGTFDAAGHEQALAVPLPFSASVFLAQRRTGEIVVEIQPTTHLDPMSIYQVRVLGTVKGLDGTPLGPGFVGRF